MLAGLKMLVADSGKEQVEPNVGRDNRKVCFTFFMALSWVRRQGLTPWMGGSPGVLVDNDDRMSQLELYSQICLSGSHICFVKPLHLSRLHFSTYKMD